MKLKLNKLTIRNFKGITDYEIELNGDSYNVQGDNGTGKTTLYDAFLFCLFGKNSQDQPALGQSTFDWKPLDEQGREMNHLETEVALVLGVNGKDIKLSRMITEDWTKKRGSAVETFSGHTTTYRIDDLKVKKKEYDELLSEWISEDLFKLLTNVTYFPETMKWQDRRETLIDMVGDVTDEDVIAKNNELQPLKELIEERPADELKQLIQQNMRQINTDLKSIPNRIDEVNRSLPDLSELDQSELEKERDLIEEKIDAKRNEILELKNSDVAIETKAKISELNLHYREMQMEYDVELSKELEGTYDEQELIEEQIRAKKSELRGINEELEEVNRKTDRLTGSIAMTDVYLKDLRQDFVEIRDKEMAPFDEHQTTCPTCSQDLPEEEILKLRNDYENKIKEFNEQKVKDLKELNEKGQEKSLEKAEKEKELEHLTKVVKPEFENAKEATEKHLKELEKELVTIESQVDRIRNNQNPFEDTEEAIEIKEKIKDLEQQLENGESTVDEDVAKINNQINVLRDKLSSVNDNLQAFKTYENQSKRKEELIAQEGNLSVKYGELEQQLHLLDEFTRTKVDLLTDTINDKFKYVKFKLFEEQINGGLKEVCEVTMNGANYSTGLNNAARINAGLDIVNTLMKHYETHVPVFIDNAESVNELIDIDTQLITLSVSKHKNLRAEVL